MQSTSFADQGRRPSASWSATAAGPSTSWPSGPVSTHRVT